MKFISITTVAPSGMLVTSTAHMTLHNCSVAHTVDTANRPYGTAAITVSTTTTKLLKFYVSW